MNSIHLHDVHFPKGPNLFALSVGDVILCAMAVLFFALSWLIGGDEFVNDIGGSVSLACLLAGLIVGLVMCVMTKPEK